MTMSLPKVQKDMVVTFISNNNDAYVIETAEKDSIIIKARLRRFQWLWDVLECIQIWLVKKWGTR
jgi:hypothetical protein